MLASGYTLHQSLPTRVLPSCGCKKITSPWEFDIDSLNKHQTISTEPQTISPKLSNPKLPLEALYKKYKVPGWRYNSGRNRKKGKRTGKVRLERERETRKYDPEAYFLYNRKKRFLFISTLSRDMGQNKRKGNGYANAELTRLPLLRRDAKYVSFYYFTILE
jgi:hypothetical protein